MKLTAAEEAAAKVVLLGATVVEKLFEDEGDSLGRLVRINNVPLTVVGVLARKGQGPSGWDQDDVAFVSLSTAKLRVLGGTHVTNRRAIGYIYVKVAEAGTMKEAT